MANYFAGMLNVPGAPGGSEVAQAQNPLLDPRFIIPGGQTPYNQPFLPFDKTPQELDKQMYMTVPPATASFGLPGGVGNMAGMMASASNPFYAPDNNLGETLYGAPVPPTKKESAPVRFNPNDLAVPPPPNYRNFPGYDPTRMELMRDQFILSNPKSGVS